MGAPIPFRMQTRRNFQKLDDISITSQNQFVRVDLPQVGYLSKIWVYLFGTITPGGSPSGDYDANYFPFNVLNRLTLRSNEGLVIFDTAGYNAFLVDSCMHMGFQNLNAPPAGGGFNSAGTTGPRTARQISPTGSIATAAPFCVTYTIPVAADDALTAGLILLQNQATKLTLEAQVNSLSAFAAVGDDMGTGPSLALTMRAVAEWFSVPADPNSQPNTDYIFRTVQEDSVWTATGDQIYRVPVSGVVSRIITDWENDGVPQTFFGTASDPTDPNFGDLTVQYAGSSRPEVEDFRVHLSRQLLQYGFDLPDGVIVHDFSLGGGSLEAGWDGRDVYDTGLLTEFAILTNISATPTAGKVRYVRQELQRRVA